MAEAAPATTSRAGILARFLRFGLLAFGGPVAQIAMLRRELVDEERWIDGPRFNRLLAVYQVLPGPEAHELAVHLGMLRGGRVGGLVAGLGFMLPGFLLMLLLSWLYFSIDLTQPAIAALLLGAQVGVIALIVRASERIGRHVVVDRALLALAAAAFLASLTGVPFWLVLPAAGLGYAIARRVPGGHVVPIVLLALAVVAAALAAPRVLAELGALAATPVAAAPTAGPGAVAVPAVVPSTLELFASGLKAGLLTFGGAYTAIPYLREDAVGSGWMSDARFLDGIALGGVLPAPLIIFSTFVGYVAGGLPGALAMTAGVFLPAFAMTLILGDRLEAIVANPTLHRVLEGVAAGVVGLIVATALDLGVALAFRLPSLAVGAAILVAGLAVLLRWRSRWSVAAVVLGSALAGLAAFGGLA